MPPEKRKSNGFFFGLEECLVLPLPVLCHRKELDQAVHGMVGTADSNCPLVWESEKPVIPARRCHGSSCERIEAEVRSNAQAETTLNAAPGLQEKVPSADCMRSWISRVPAWPV